jgi:protein-L-isoaspartate(D-aspartate) O-methyltransferase
LSSGLAKVLCFRRSLIGTRDFAPGCLPLAIFVGLIFSGATCDAAAQPDDQRLVSARNRMVDEEIVAAGVRDDRVIESMRKTPRHLFIPESQRHLAYLDAGLPIGESQTISSPYVVAKMTEQLEPLPQDKVLEIGTGSGYQAAVLSPLVAEVYTIEIVEPLGRKAADTLKQLGYSNVHTRIGDGFLGWEENAPFDKIIVTCSPERVPPALVAQLREGGRIVIPLGARYQQSLCLMKKSGGKMQTEFIESTFFVPMTGQAEAIRRTKNDTGLPELVNGSFETALAGGEPTGWYYLRQASVVEDARAPDGNAVLQFSNTTAGRNSQALQSMAVDGRKVREIDVSLWIKMDQVRKGQTNEHSPRLELVFFDAQRAPVGSSVLGPWRGSGGWTKKRMRAKVPEQARLMGIAVGLFGGTGQLTIDNLAVEAHYAQQP